MKWEPGDSSSVGELKGHDREGFAEKLLALRIVGGHGFSRAARPLNDVRRRLKRRPFKAPAADYGISPQTIYSANLHSGR